MSRLLTPRTPSIPLDPLLNEQRRECSPCLQEGEVEIGVMTGGRGRGTSVGIGIHCQMEVKMLTLKFRGDCPLFGQKRGSRLKVIFVFNLFCEIHDMHCIGSFVGEFGSL